MSLDAPSQASPPIGSLDDLVSWLKAGEKPRGPMRVGLETEKFGVLSDGRPAPLSGEKSIGRLLELIAERTKGELLVENAVPMGVQLPGHSLALEPGGQLELSGVPTERLSDIEKELGDHLSLVEELSGPLGIRWTVGGYRPFHRAEVPWLPRFRYQLMRERLPGSLAHEMMQATASVQANYDFTSESDLAEKLAVASLVSPLTAAACAASPLSNGRPNGFQSLRYHIWSDVDRSRSGLVRVMYEGYTHRAYAEWALKIPLLFVRRGGEYLEPEGRTLQDVWEHGFRGEPASMQDWVDLVSTLFPEIRVKRVIEVRGADAVDARTSLALAALWTGLFYDPEARSDARRLISPTFEALLAFQPEVARRGFDARLEGVSARELFQDVVRIARAGLVRRHARGESESEAHYLEPFEELANGAPTLAERLLALPEGDVDAVIRTLACR